MAAPGSLGDNHTRAALEALFDRARDGSAILRVHAQPGATRTEIVGLHGDALKVRVHAVADRGKANAALSDALAGWFGLPIHAVVLLSGQTNRSKRFALHGLDVAAAVERLEKCGG